MRERKLNTLRSLDGLKRTRADNLVIRVAPFCICDPSHRRAIAIPTYCIDAIKWVMLWRAIACSLIRLSMPLNELHHEYTTMSGLTRVADFRDGNAEPATFQVVC